MIKTTDQLVPPQRGKVLVQREPAKSAQPAKQSPKAKEQPQRDRK